MPLSGYLTPNTERYCRNSSDSSGDRSHQKPDTGLGEPGPTCPKRQKSVGHQKNLKTAWRRRLKRAGVPYFRIYDLRSTYATRLSAGGVADEWVTQSSQGDAKVFKKYSQMKLQMKREARENDRQAMRCHWILAQHDSVKVFGTVLAQ